MGALEVGGAACGAIGRLDSWKEIAAYLKRGARTVQRWEREEGLPVRRLQHGKLGSVYGYKPELDAWWAGRGEALENQPGLENRHGADATPSVAVMPFADLSPDQDQAHFCDGVAEEIIHALSRIQGLRAASRSSSFRVRTPGMDSRQIGRQLGVRTLLEGSVRMSGGRFRIAVQLVDTETGFQLWSERYDRQLSDMFRVQDEIAGNVAQRLEVALTPALAPALAPGATKPPTSDTRASDCYLRGRKFYYQYSPGAMEFAIQLFIRAIEMDPSYARAYAGLADCWSYTYLYAGRSEDIREQAEWASLRAVEMDPQSAQAQASRGLSLSLSGRNAEAERAFESAARLDPELFEAYYFHARHCFALGQLERAARLYEKSMRARPEDYQAPLLCAQIHDGLGRTADAAAARKRGVHLAEEHLKWNPDDARAMYMAANGLVFLGDPRRGRQLAERALALRPDDPMLLYNIGCVFCLLGLVEPALDHLEKAADLGMTQKGWYQHDSNLNRLRTEPRFHQLLQRL